MKGVGDKNVDEEKKEKKPERDGFYFNPCSYDKHLLAGHVYCVDSMQQQHPLNTSSKKV
jgi:hypothetical protein